MAHQVYTDWNRQGIIEVPPLGNYTDEWLAAHDYLPDPKEDAFRGEYFKRFILKGHDPDRHPIWNADDTIVQIVRVTQRTRGLPTPAHIKGSWSWHQDIMAWYEDDTCWKPYRWYDRIFVKYDVVNRPGGTMNT